MRWTVYVAHMRKVRIFFFFFFNEIYNLLSILRVFSKFVDSIDFVVVAGQNRFTLNS
jgi:hypothetical protein